MSVQDETQTGSIETVSIKDRPRTSLDKWFVHVQNEFTVTNIKRLVDDYDDILVFETEQGFNVLVNHELRGIDIWLLDVDAIVGETFEVVEETRMSERAYHLVLEGETPDWKWSKDEKEIFAL